MTIEEAINLLNEIPFPSAQHLKAAGIAKEALQKQIPKKPVRYKNTTYCKCPNCGSFNVYDYCNDCGQRLDWSEEE